MNRLKAIAGGQPLRSDDWTYIQDAFVNVIKSLVEGMTDKTGVIIIKGLEVSTDATHTYVSEGVVFDGDELRHVAAASFETQGVVVDAQGNDAFRLYLTPSSTTSEQRTFKDTTLHDVWEQRIYTVGYAETVPTGSVWITGLERLPDLITDYVVSHMPASSSGADLLYIRKSFNPDDLDQGMVVLPKPGSGKVNQVVSMMAYINPSTALQVGSQILNVMYGLDVTDTGIGSFPNNFLESSIPVSYDMTPAPGKMYPNEYVSIGLSAETRPDSGAATITIYCVYKIVTL